MWSADDERYSKVNPDEEKLKKAIDRRTWLGFKTPFSPKELCLFIAVGGISLTIASSVADVESRRKDVFSWRVFTHENAIKAEKAKQDARELAWRNCMVRFRDSLKCSNFQLLKAQ
jgi:hypothetical protein